MTRFLRLILFLSLLFATSRTVNAQSEVGWASWYDGGFSGMITASGESYQHDALTAAHPTLPFGSLARVTRTDTGRSVTVRVNDRMTAEPNHVIDVSGGAARRLGLLESGIALVRVETVTSESVPVSTKPPAEVSAFTGITLQLGVFSSRGAAAALASEHVDTWIQAVQADGGLMYRVYYREFDSEEAARTEQARLQTVGQDSFLRHLSANIISPQI